MYMYIPLRNFEAHDMYIHVHIWENVEYMYMHQCPKNYKRNTVERRLSELHSSEHVG